MNQEDLVERVGGDLISQEQLAEYLGVTVSTIRRWRQNRKIAFIKIHGTVRFDAQGIKDFLESHRVPPV